MTIDSIFIMVFVLFGFILVGFGHATGNRIFNLLSTGVFIFLATQLYMYLPVLVVLTGLVLFELYYTFWGN
jgi:hypothetical protein